MLSAALRGYRKRNGRFSVAALGDKRPPGYADITGADIAPHSDPLALRFQPDALVTSLP